jgi:hypothetical protein
MEGAHLEHKTAQVLTSFLALQAAMLLKSRLQEHMIWQPLNIGAQVQTPN